MTAYTLMATCPKCGGELIPGETRILSPDQSQAEARCEDCMDLYRLDVTATVIEPWPLDRSPAARLARASSRAAEGVDPILSKLR